MVQAVAWTGAMHKLASCLVCSQELSQVAKALHQQEGSISQSLPVSCVSFSDLIALSAGAEQYS